MNLQKQSQFSQRFSTDELGGNENSYIAFGKNNTNTDFDGCTRKGADDVYSKLKWSTDAVGSGAPQPKDHNAVKATADAFATDVEAIVFLLQLWHDLNWVINGLL